MAFTYYMAADRMHIPVIIHAPLPIDVFAYMTGMLYPKKDNMWECFGCTLVCPSVKFAAIYQFMWGFADKDLCEQSLNLANRMVLTNIYPGFDKATHVQPNFVQAGPIMDPDLTETRARLERVDPDLAAWMNEAHELGEDIVYITLGSEA
jgi:hypothetical protein